MGFVHRKAMTGVGFNFGVEVQHDELRFRDNGSLAEMDRDNKGRIGLPRNPRKNTENFVSIFPCLPCSSVAKSRLLLARALTLVLRSEERRVGKECRSRWSQDH